MDFATMSNDDLTAALATARESATALFALTEPTIEQVNEAEALVASIGAIEGEQATRAAAIKDAEQRFAAARATFSAEAEAEEETEDEAEAEAEEETEIEAEAEVEAEAVAAAADDEIEASVDADNDEGGEAAEEETVTAGAGVNHTTTQKISAAAAARTVARKTKRPARAANRDVVITASADVPNFSTGQRLDGMAEVTKALINRTKGFAPFSAQAAKQAHAASGGREVLHKFGVASFGVPFDSSLVASKAGDDYNVVRAALKQDRFSNDVLTAGGWCAPSETVYSFIADYVVDGLISVPEVSAPRGGLNLTTGPVRSSQGAALDAFGFTQTEAEAIAREVKTCETIVCPDFEDHRLDAIGYCYKIPILTQKAYPEIVEDALRYAQVLYAHKVNARIINDLVALSDVRTFSGYGASFTDALEALAILATKERRKWNIGENATMEVKLPVWAKEVFRADMSRRTGLALTDVATDQKIAAEFAARNLAVEYVADWQELTDVNIVLPGAFQAMVYPAGTFIKAVEDVINLSAVYDAASLSINEYTGVFFEQGILTAKAGYGSSLITVPVNTAGETGAAIMTGLGDSTAAGSF